MRITIVVCTRNRADSLAGTLHAFSLLEVPSHIELEFVIVDNGSTDNTRIVVERMASTLPIQYYVEHTPGLSYARNKAAEVASGEITLWADDDILVDTEWLVNYVDAIEKHPEATFFGGPISPYFEAEPGGWIGRHFEFFQGAYSLIDLGGSSVTLPRGLYPIGGNMGIRRSVFETYKFNVSLGRKGTALVGGEDTEFFARLFDDGRYGVWVAYARVRHRLGAEKMRLRYLWRWYLQAGMTTVLLSLKRSRMFDSTTAFFWEKVSSNWETFFSGPYTVRLFKLVAYSIGFFGAVSDHRSNHPSGSPTADFEDVDQRECVLGFAHSQLNVAREHDVPPPSVSDVPRVHKVDRGI